MSAARKRAPFELSVTPLGLLAAAGYTACAATALGFLGRFWWFADLFSHFRIQYLIGLAVAGAVMLFGRQLKTATGFFAFAAANLACVAPLYFGADANGAASPALRLVLLNVNSDSGDPARVREAIAALDPDVVALKEVNGRWMDALEPLLEEYPHVLAEPREDNFGIALFSKLPLVRPRVAEIGAAGVPSLIASVPAGSVLLDIVATHPLPPYGAEYSALRDEQLARLAEAVDPSRPVVLLGDLNTTPWNYHFRRLLERSGLRDSARGRGPLLTWPSFCLPLRVPINHILHSPSVTVLRRSIGPDVGSDHFPVMVDVSLRSPQQPRSVPPSPHPQSSPALHTR